MIEDVGFAAFVLDVIATWLFTKKHLWAWPISLLSLGCWWLYGMMTHDRPIVVSTSVFTVICLYGWWRWWKDEQELEE
jgi:uncharacterized membrane protein